jgi:hypothetical protein
MQKAKKVVTMSAMLCGNQEFQVWLLNSGMSDDVGEDHAAAALRKYLNITSRADLKTNKDAREKFLKLVDTFETEMR